MYFDEIIFLADEGFYEKAIFHFCGRNDININFIITSEINNPIRQQLSAQGRIRTELEKSTNETRSEVIKPHEFHSLSKDMYTLHRDFFTDKILF